MTDPTRGLAPGLLALLMGMGAPAHAADPPTVPDAGSVLRDLPRVPLRPPPPDADQVLPARPRPPAAAPAAAGASFVLKGLSLSGQTAFDEASLLALVSDAIGQTVDLAGLEALADRITRHYRAAGYTVARAYLPAQDVVDGRVVIGVVEGRFGAVVLRGAPQLPQRLLPLNRLRPGALVTDASLERALLLTADLAGLRIASTLEPGTEVGTSRLVVDVTPGPRGSARLELDNHGSAATGRIRTGSSLTLLNAAGLGDSLNVRLLFAQDDGLHLGRLSWQVPLNAAGTSASASASTLRYRLGGEFEALGVTGRAHVAGLAISHPVLRSRHANLGVSFGHETKRLSDAFENVGTVSNKRVEATSLSLNGDLIDSWGGSGASRLMLALTHGRLRLGGADAQALDAATAQAEGRSERVSLGLLRLQAIGEATVSVSLRGQWTRKNLDSSEKLPLGGIDGVRAYPVGEAAGDQAQLLSLEWRRPVAAGLQLQALLDAGWSRINARPWADARGSNQRHLAGAGLGLLWEPLRGFGLDLVYAQRLTAAPSGQADTARGRWWVQGSIAL